LAQEFGSNKTGRLGLCILFVAMRVLAACAVLSIASAQETCVASEWEQDTSYHMGAPQDIGHVAASDSADCCSKCKGTSGCKAWTLTGEGECWLHKGGGNRQHSVGTVSGFLNHQTTVITTTAAPTPPPTQLAPAIPDPTVTGPVQVYVMMGQSNMLGEGHLAGWTEETLQHATAIEGRYPYLVDEKENQWTQLDSIRDVAVMGSGGPDGSIGSLHHNEWMSPNPTKKTTIGPELGIGYAMGLNGTKAPTMLLKSCIGNRALGWDLLPPGTKEWEHDYGNGKVSVFAGYGESPSKWDKGSVKPDPASWYAGLQYDGDVYRTKMVLDNLATFYPGATSYEVAGFFWWQGDKDMRDPGYFMRYEFNLVNLIKQLRTEFNAPNAKFVTASLGQTEMGSTGGDGQILNAMLAVDGESGKYPEFKGNVATVYTHPLSEGSSSSAHYGGNAKTYMNIGEAMGAAMNKLLATENTVSV